MQVLLFLKSKRLRTKRRAADGSPDKGSGGGHVLRSGRKELGLSRALKPAKLASKHELTIKAFQGKLIKPRKVEPTETHRDYWGGNS